MADDDDSLMLEVREGHTAQLAILFERHHTALFQFFYRLTANRDYSEDLVQDVFVRLLKYKQTYRPRTSFRAWLYQVARNAHLDTYRRRRESQWPEEFAEPASGEPAVEARLGREQETAILRKALAALPPDKQEVLILSRYQDLKYEEIGAILGCQTGAVKLRVFRAVRALGEAFQQIAGERAV